MPAFRYWNSARGVAASKGLAISLTLMLIIAVAYGFGVYLFSSLVPLIREDLNISYPTVGLILSARQFGFLLTSLLTGLVVSRFGAVRVVLGSVFVICVGLIAISVLKSPIVLTGSLVVLNCAAASVWIPMVSVIKAELAENRQGQALGFIASGTNYGVLANGVLIAVLEPSIGWRGIFALTAVVSAGLLALAMVTIRPSKAAINHSGRSTRNHVPRGIAIVRQYLPALRWPYSVLGLVAFFGGVGGIPFLSFWSSLGIEDLRLAPSLVGASWTLMGVLGTVSGFLVGMVGDRIGIRETLAGAIAGLDIAIAAVLTLHGSAGFLIASALFGLVFFPIYGLIPAYVGKSADSADVPFILSLTESALALGAILGTMLASWGRVMFGNFEAVYASLALAFGLMFAFTAFLPPTAGKSLNKFRSES